MSLSSTLPRECGRFATPSRPLAAYETDAKVEKRVRVVDFFPADSHPPIVYPVAVTAKARPAARQFVEFLQSAPAQEAFKKYGFQDPPKR